MKKRSYNYWKHRSNLKPTLNWVGFLFSFCSGSCAFAGCDIACAWACEDGNCGGGISCIDDCHDYCRNSGCGVYWVSDCSANCGSCGATCNRLCVYDRGCSE